jgi:tRNA(fMet)-specific endonuclease VapC
MEKFVLDTDICSYIMLGANTKLLDNLESHKNDKLRIAAVTYAELLYGAFRKDSKRILGKISVILSRVSVIPFDQDAAVAYAKIRVESEKNGTPIGNMDMLIAASAISQDAILVTNNVKHFSKINNLKIQNWTDPAVA